MRLWASAVVLLCTLLAAPLDAGNPKKKKKDKEKDADVSVTVVFGTGDRDAVRRYFLEKHGRGKCPPGLAKKNNGCLPPGLARKRYIVGRPLPSGVEVLPLSAELSIRIGRAPDGYRYGMIDGDLVKLAVGTMLVVDAIEGLVE